VSHTRRLWSLWLLVAFAPVVHADDTNSPAKKPAASTTPAPAKPAAAPSADDELLEFLGSIGEESDGEWIEFLSKTDIPKTTKAKAKDTEK
jgi:hypothetical protein